MAALQLCTSIGLRRLRVHSNPLHHLSLRHSPNNILVVKLPWKTLAMQPSVQYATEDDTQIELVNKKCAPCHSKEVRPMAEEPAKQLLQKVPGWKLLNEAGHLKLQRSWKAKSFVKGLEFFKLIADVAEAEDHHPDLHLVKWNDVIVEIWTHSIGGLTESDFILAAKISALNVEGLLKKRASGEKSSTS